MCRIILHVQCLISFCLINSKLCNPCISDPTRFTLQKGVLNIFLSPACHCYLFRFQIHIAFLTFLLTLPRALKGDNPFFYVTSVTSLIIYTDVTLSRINISLGAILELRFCIPFPTRTKKICTLWYRTQLVELSLPIKCRHNDYYI